MSKKLTKLEQDKLIETLKERFNKSMNFHPGFIWDDVEAKILANPSKLWTLNEMERTGGQPNLVVIGEFTGEYTFYDCALQTPELRRNTCYDNEALESRKKFKPDNSAIGMAQEMGFEILNENQYRKLQEIFEFDTKTSSWVLTPEDVRSLGGAYFCDRRYNKVFLYHNGAESYYSVRGFRGFLKI